MPELIPMRPVGLPAPLQQTRRTLVMGILNVTPDSFSDGGRFIDVRAALRRAEELLAQGADIIDVGGESTRPGAAPVDPAVEAQRVLPVIEELVAVGAVVSIDTMHAATATAAVAKGAALVNDVSGGLVDPGMFAAVAALEVPYVLMHWREHSDTRYVDVVAEVTTALRRQAERAVDCGISERRIVLDPGLGFAKDAHHNWSLLASLRLLGGDSQFPLLVGASRKRFLGELLAGAGGEPRPTERRDDATAAISTLCAAAGAWCVRVHDAAASADAVRVVAAWQAAAEGGHA